MGNINPNFTVHSSNQDLVNYLDQPLTIKPEYSSLNYIARGASNRHILTEPYMSPSRGILKQPQDRRHYVEPPEDDRADHLISSMVSRLKQGKIAVEIKMSPQATVSDLSRMNRETGLE